MDDLSALRGNWSYPTSVRFGAGRIMELPEACASLGMRRPLLITDAGLAALPILAEARRRCEQAGLPSGLFADVKSNPTEANVAAGVAAWHAGGHDGIIAFGGGSGLDAAKAVALMVGQTRPIWDFEDIDDWWTRANAEAIPPIAAVPTTAGTGSEVGRAAVITNPATHTKKIIFHPKLMPRIVIADPELTRELPAKLTAWTGMDAFSHSLEAYCASGFHPMADGIALEAMRLIHRYLPRATHDGNDMAARAHMLVASAMGASAFQKGLGAMHALSHPVGGVFDRHHGLTNAVVMPYVLVFNRPAIEAKLTALARYLDLPKPSFAAVLDWVLALRRDIAIPHTLAELGVSEARVDVLAQMAAIDPAGGGNPRPLDRAVLAELYRRAIAGDLNSW